MKAYRPGWSSARPRSQVSKRTRTRGPLAGCRVLELCTTVAGPACARLLADYGAEVIKIESFDGDPIRSMGYHDGDVSLYAASILRNKRSIAMDLKTPEGRDLARRIAAKCDVVVENFRPGKLEKLGLGYDVLSKDNPRAVLVRISGYGQSGPYRNQPGYGTVCEAFGGVRHVTGFPDRPPARVSVALTDYVTALYAAFGAMLALRERDASGRGQVVDTALYEAAFSLLEPDVPAFQRLGLVANRQGSRFPGLAPNNLYPTKEGGYILIAANNDAIFQRLCEAMGQRGLPEDRRFSSIRARAANARAIDAIVSRWTRSRTSRSAIAALARAAVPSSLVYTMKDAFRDPQYRARKTVVNVAHPVLGSIAMAGLVPRLSRTPGRIRRAGPEIGADARFVLRNLLGLSGKHIAKLQEQGVLATDKPGRRRG